MSCELDLMVGEGVSAAIERVRGALLGAGGQFAGDESAGTFGLTTPIGAIKGRYAVNGPSMHVSIDEKPMLLGCGMIEDRLKAALRDGKL
jgi:hypothetical protein